MNTDPMSGTTLATIILPAYNEAEALPKVLDDIYATLDEQYEILVVDDGSKDATADIVQRYPCKVLRHEKNQGKGAAVRTGLKQAQGKFVVIMDADATYPASAIPIIIEHLEKQGLVRCVRKETLQNMPLVNRIGNVLFDFVLNKIAGLDGKDQLSGLYGARLSDLQSMKLESDGFDIEAEINMKSHLKGMMAYTLPIEYFPRVGEKKLRPFRDGWRILQRILLMILIVNPILVFILPGFLVMLTSIIGAIILNETNITTPYFGLSIHSFILATIGILAGFQIMIFGIAASLYSVESGRQPRSWLVWVSSARIRLGTAAVGIVLVILGSLLIVLQGLEWFRQGAGDFLQTRQLVINAVTIVGGLQLLSAAMYISIFASKIARKSTKHPR